MKRLAIVFVLAMLTTGCEMKGGDPVITTTGKIPAPTVTKVPVTLTWAPATGTVQGYKIEGSLDNVTFMELGTAPANANGVIVNALKGATFYFRVRAYNSGGNGPYTAVTQITL